MGFRWSQWNIGGKLVFVSICVAVASLLFPWVQLGPLSANGLSQGGFLFLPLWIYPGVKLLKSRGMSRLISLACASIVLIGCIIYIASKQAELFGRPVNAAGLGPIVMLLAAVCLGIGVLMYKTQPATEQELA